MSRHKRIIVRGKQKPQIDANLLVQVLLAIARDWESSDAAEAEDSPDTLHAAIEDAEAGR